MAGEERIMTQYDKLTRNELRMIASELTDRVQTWADGRSMTTEDHRLYQRKMARATFLATMAITAPEGDVTKLEPAPEPVTATPETQRGHFAFEGVVYDLGARYHDREGDVWEFTGDALICGMPKMWSRSVDVAHHLAHVVSEWGPLTREGASVSSDPYCHRCGYWHGPAMR